MLTPLRPVSILFLWPHRASDTVMCSKIPAGPSVQREASAAAEIAKGQGPFHLEVSGGLPKPPSSGSIAATTPRVRYQAGQRHE